ncbi:hypothetical protein BC834DRAFT_498864 [Gloeopeniophorella convolvens]|nr:hypothetical protein BC834DRAFT_498864 [Gloeopeniophorella convolvens]
MSLSHSTLLSRGQSVVALTGAQTPLGQRVVQVFLSKPYRPFFSRLILLAPSTSTGRIDQRLAEDGAEVVLIPDGVEAISNALSGVDVLVDADFERSSESTLVLIHAARAKRIVAYLGCSGSPFESEEELPSDENPKIVALSWGLLMDDLKGEDLGHGPGGSQSSAAISPTEQPTSVKRVTLTSATDIGRAFAELALRCMSSSLAPRIPRHVRIAGDTVSWPSYARAPKRPDDLDLSRENENELINEGQYAWHWTSLEQMQTCPMFVSCRICPFERIADSTFTLQSQETIRTD